MVSWKFAVWSKVDHTEVFGCHLTKNKASTTQTLQRFIFVGNANLMFFYHFVGAKEKTESTYWVNMGREKKAIVTKSTCRLKIKNALSLLYDLFA